MERIFLAAGLACVGLTIVTFSVAREPREKKFIIENPLVATGAHAPTQPLLQKQDTVPAAKNADKDDQSMIFNYSKDGKQYQWKQVDGKLVELSVDGKKIPPDHFKDYEKIIDEVTANQNEKIAMMKLKETQMALNQKEMAEKSKMMADQQAILEKRAAEQYEATQAMTNERLARAALDMKIAQERMNEQNMAMKIDQEKLVRQLNEKMARDAWEMKVAQESASENEKAMKIDQEKLVHQLNENNNRIVLNGVTYVPEKDASYKGSKTARASDQVSNSDELVTDILNDLLSDRIIKSDENIAFELNKQKFTVNGAKQPAEVLKRYAGKYLKGSKDYVKYSLSKNSKHTDIYFE